MKEQIKQTLELNSQINRLVEERLKTEVKKFKAEYFKTINSSGNARKRAVKETLTASSLSKKQEQILDIITESSAPLDRHTILDLMREKHGTCSPGTISGRLFDLQNAGLIKVVGLTTGIYNKDISLYDIA